MHTPTAALRSCICSGLSFTSSWRIKKRLYNLFRSLGRRNRVPFLHLPRRCCGISRGTTFAIHSPLVECELLQNLLDAATICIPEIGKIGWLRAAYVEQLLFDSLKIRRHQRELSLYFVQPRGDRFTASVSNRG